MRWLATTSIRKKRPGVLGKTQSDHDGSRATLNNVNNLEAMAMTCDEWLSTALDNAEAAESPEVDSQQSESLLDRATYCFEQAEASELAAKARSHRLSVQFQSELKHIKFSDYNISNKDPIEMKAANMLETLLQENLLSEALNLCYSISPFLSPYAKNEINRNLMSKIRLAVSGN